MKRVRKLGQMLMLIIMGCSAIIAGCSGGGGGGSKGFISLNPSPTGTATLHIDNANVQVNNNAIVSATFADTNGQPISGLKVTFATTLGSLNPASGSVSTDSNGTAMIQLQAGATTGSGAVSASATVQGSKISRQISFRVIEPLPVISTPVVGLSNLAPGGSTSITVNLTDSNGNPITTPVQVNFNSSFAMAGKAKLLSPVTSVNGTASSTYTALAGAVGTDTITVSIGGASVVASVTVAAPAASAISFVSATPANITLKGMGGAGGSESSLVIFKVLDTSGQPKAGQAVDFALNTSVGGLSLTSASGSSADDGTVSTIVLSGTIATPVRVTASIHGSSPLIATQSDMLVVSTGIPAQDGLSISASTINAQTWNHDGVHIHITARLSDHFHNPVPDGTAVYFTTNGGVIQPSCTTTGGGCTVDWISQDPRPSGYGTSLLGRPVILAYAVGEESFLDSNGNGVADSGPCVPVPVAVAGVGMAKQCGEFIDTPEAFRDDNMNGVKDPDETFIDFNGDGIFNGPDGIYNGILRPSTVSGPRTKHVFQNIQLVMCTDAPIIRVTDKDPSDPTATDLTQITAPMDAIYVLVTDGNGNTMASGSKVEISTDLGKLSGSIATDILNNNGYGVLLVPRLAATNTPPKAGTGTLTIKVTNATGTVFNYYVYINGNF